MRKLLSNMWLRASAVPLACVSLLVAASLTGSGAATRPSSIAPSPDELTNCTVAYAADESGAFGGNNRPCGRWVEAARALIRNRAYATSRFQLRTTCATANAPIT